MSSAFDRTCAVWQSRSESGGAKGVNIGDMERTVSVVAGGGMALLGLRNLASLPGLLMTAMGGGLIYRGVTGHCTCYEQLGINTAKQKPNTAVAARHGTKVEKCILINRSPEEVYRFWRKLENLPQFMEHLESVREIDSMRSHWVAKGPMGMQVEWDAEIFNERPNEMIAWRSMAGSEVDTAGSVHFVAAPGGRGTEVRVSLKYDPPAGKLGIALAQLFGEDAHSQMNEDLVRLKRVLEAGELPTTEGQTSGRCAATTPNASAVGASRPADVVDEAVDESFPASDPPSFTATSASTTGGPDRYA